MTEQSYFSDTKLIFLLTKFPHSACSTKIGASTKNVSNQDDLKNNIGSCRETVELNAYSKIIF